MSWLKLALLLASLRYTVAQSSNETIHSVVVYHNGCDRTAIVSGGKLTSKGANQCYSSGTFFRNRYFSSGVTQINGTFPDYSDNAAGVINAVTPQGADANLQFIQAGTAFMQGLFPPVAQSGIITGAESQGNGSISDASQNPVNGYQYFVIDAFSKMDPNSIGVSGTELCPQHDHAADAYLKTEEFSTMLLATNEFYLRIVEQFMNGIDVNPSYADAYRIYDYIAQNFDTLKALGNFSETDLFELRSLASVFEFNRYANVTTSPSSSWRSFAAQTPPGMRDIGARTLMSYMYSLLSNSAEFLFNQNKFNFLMGSFESFLSFFAITELSSLDDSFKALPNFGAALILEVFSLADAPAITAAGYVDSSKLHVRFLFKNGTDAEATVYPLFNKKNENKTMLWNDFSQAFADASVTLVADWCNLCASYATFCSKKIIVNGGTISLGSSASKKKVSPAVAGVIGAIVTLFLTAALATLAFFVFGFFLTRDPRRRRTSIMSGLQREKQGNESEIELPLSPRASAMGQGGHGTWDSPKPGDAGLLKMPGNAHLKDLEDRT